MTIEQFYDKKEPAPVQSSTGNTICGAECASSAIGEYITIPVVLYTELIRESGLLELVGRVLTDKRFKYLADKVEIILTVLDLPNEEDGE